jgi:hypothetical protein
MFSISRWWKNHRMRRELKALKELKKFLSLEKNRIKSLTNLVNKIIGFVENHNFDDAEKGASELMYRMRQKKMIDIMEERNFKIFKKTILKELHSKMEAVK